jgi:hypothetical protein
MSEHWDVEVGYGQIHTMTLDELDAAYQAGSIVETTRVREHGAMAWSTLAVVAGLEESAPPSAPSMNGPNSLAPTAVSLAMPTPSTGFDLTPQPPAIDLDDLDESNAARRLGRSKVPMILGGLGVVAVIGLAAFAVPKALRAADANQAMKAAAASKATSFDPRSATGLTEDELSRMRQKLTDEQARRLEEADKRRAEETARKNAEAARKAAEAAAKQAPARKGGKGSEPFVKGGSKFDPLNGSL